MQHNRNVRIQNRMIKARDRVQNSLNHVNLLADCLTMEDRTDIYPTLHWAIKRAYEDLKELESSYKAFYEKKES